jgi:tetratricopeptide (TPR) repeat protein
VLVATERYEEALEYAEAAHEMAAETVSENHWRTAIAMSAEGAALSGLGRFEEAETLLRRGYEILRNDDGALPMFIASAKEQLDRLYARWGRSPSATTSP